MNPAYINQRRIYEMAKTMLYSERSYEGYIIFSMWKGIEANEFNGANIRIRIAPDNMLIIGTEVFAKVDESMRMPGILDSLATNRDFPKRYTRTVSVFEAMPVKLPARLGGLEIPMLLNVRLCRPGAWVKRLAEFYEAETNNPAQFRPLEHEAPYPLRSSD